MRVEGAEGFVVVGLAALPLRPGGVYRCSGVISARLMTLS